MICVFLCGFFCFFFFKQKTAYEMRISDWSSDVCSSDLQVVKRANKSLGCFPPILQALGLLDTQDPEEMRLNMAALQDDTQEAAARREALRAAQIGRAHVWTPVTNEHLVCRLLLENTKYQRSQQPLHHTPHTHNTY